MNNRHYWMFYYIWVSIVLIAMIIRQKHVGIEFFEIGVKHVFEQLNIIYMKEATSFTFVVKIVLLYLYYQFVIAIRKDTRK